jgi:AraC family transcriptional activator FtrA
MRTDLTREWQAARLAKLAGMSIRTFLRRFEAATGTTPAKWLLAERLTMARDLLESTEVSIEEVAEIAGFGTTATLRHHFRRQLSTTPAAYRASFGKATRIT